MSIEKRHPTIDVGATATIPWLSVDEVPCKATRILLEAAEESGVALGPLLDGFRYDLAFLRDVKRRIAWDDFAVLCERLDLLAGGPRALETIGERLVRVPAYAFVQRVAATMVTPRQLHHTAFHWVAPPLWPHLRMSIANRGDGRKDGALIVTVEIPDGYKGCAPFFHVCRGSIAAITTLIDRPMATVLADITPYKAVFTVLLPPEAPLFERLRRAIHARVSQRALIAELQEQQQELTASYRSLLRSKQDFREVIGRLPDGIFVHADGNIRWANPALLSILGYADSRAILGIHMLEICDPRDREVIAGCLSRPPPAVPSRESFRLIRADGGRAVCEMASTALTDFEGAPARLVVVRDVTERNRMQEKLLVADKMASLGMIAASVAHEINNPLAYAYTSLEVAAKAVGAPDGRSRAEQSLAIAREGLDRVRAIVMDLKTFSRADEDVVAAVDVHAILDSTLSLAGATLRPRANVLRDYGDVPLVRGNEARLGQVFLNLLTNAAEAAAEPRVERHTIRIRTEVERDGRVAIAFSDTGEGIAPSHALRIFDPFFTTKPSGGGTGLGLAICQRIVTQLGGELRVSSSTTSEFRTTFRVILPAAEVVGRKTAPPKPEERKTPRARVLVVDDEPGILNVVRLLLGDAHHVVVASNAAEARAAIALEATFDVILCDLMMPGMSGVELFETLRVTHPGLESRIVFMTGGAFTADVRDFLAALPNACLEKPFRAEELFARIRDHLRPALDEERPALH